jgi:hypothetical protein
MPAWTMLARFVGRWPVAEKPSTDGLRSPGWGRESPEKMTRDTRAVPTALTPAESRAYPESPGSEFLGSSPSARR